jgi:hypothetical protein
MISEPIAVLLSSGYTLNQIKTAFEDVTWAAGNNLTPDIKALKDEVLRLIEEGREREEIEC